jgi:hypothetical protein
MFAMFSWSCGPTICRIVPRDWWYERIDESERENTELRAKICEQQAILQTQQQTIASRQGRICRSLPWCLISCN